MNLKNPTVQKVLLGTVLLVVMSYLYFGTQLLPFFYQVRKAKIESMGQEYAKLSADLEKARQMVGRLAQLEAEYARLHEQWESAQELLPEEQEMPDLLRKVTAAGARAGIEFMLFQPVAPIVHEDYKEHPVKIRVRGGYHQLGIFLSRLANLDRIVNVSDLNIQSATKGKSKSSDEKATIVADFTLSAHTLLVNGGAQNEMVEKQ